MLNPNAVTSPLPATSSHDSSFDSSRVYICIAKGPSMAPPPRSFSLRDAAKFLLGRVTELSWYIAERGLEVPAMTSEDEETLSLILGKLGVTRSSLERQPGPPDHPELERRVLSVRDLCDGTPCASGQAASPPNVSTRAAGPSAPSRAAGPSIRDLCDGTPYPSGHSSPNVSTRAAAPSAPSMESMDTLTVAQAASVLYDAQHPACPPPPASSSSFIAGGLVEDDLSDRVGTLQIRPGGHIRFFGSISNFNLLDVASSDLEDVRRTVLNDGLFHLRRLGLDKQVPPAVEEHLVNLYFTWQDPSNHIVDRDMYDNARVQRYDPDHDSAYYSEALRNAM
ncbi:hypothetical protein QQX98_002476 [Neonectria punicea]|uniref:Uncharacterized protein n=1 Tax=Neonectria punicea TaxID=979145 RepID=A0ABR1HIB8_9HYPO